MTDCRHCDSSIVTPIEMVRWAPSAVNKQPWRIVRTTDSLCHFMMGLEEQGKTAAVEVSDPGIHIPDDVEYIASVQMR